MEHYSEEWRKHARAKIVTAVKIDPETRCWIWQQSCDTGGYAKLQFGKEQINGHRLSHISFNHGDDPLTPSKPMTLHRCDRKNCVNPDHLHSGSHRDNMVERDERGRTARGEAISTAKLNDGLVKTIRRDNRSDAEIASKLGVVPETIRRVRARQTWKHVQ